MKLESLEKRQLLAAGVVAPQSVELLSGGGSNAPFLEYGVQGSHWIDGSGLSNASIVQTGDPVPATWPSHEAGNNSSRVSRIRRAAEFTTLTFNLGGSFDLDGMALWNSTESGQTDRGLENTRLSYSTDGGNTFTGNDLLTWTQLTGVNSRFGPEVQSLPRLAQGVTHVRMVVDNFSPNGSDNIVMFSELRFTGTPSGPPSSVIKPVNAELKSVNGSFLQYGSPAGVHWYNGSGLSNASIVETGNTVPAFWPGHQPQNSDTRVSRIRNASEFNALTFDLGGRFDLDGMALWNSTESGQTDRGIETTRLSYSTDGGVTFSGSELLTWTQLTGRNSRFEPEVQSLARLAQGVTHVRMSVNNFSEGGSDNIVMFSELRFTGTPSGPQSSVIKPTGAELQSVNGSYLQYGTPAGVHWYNGSGLSDASIVETGNTVPAFWPGHQPQNSGSRVSRIRNANEFNGLTFDLGGRFDVDGMALWNSTESGQTDRGIETTRLSYSTDGGNSFSGSDLLTWTQLTGLNSRFEPEVQSLPRLAQGVTHVRMSVNNFSEGGSDNIVMFSELRFTGTPSGPQSSVIKPTGAELESVNGSFLQYGDPAGVHWYNGSGLSNASIVETGNTVPAFWPGHQPQNSDTRVSRIRNASEFNALTFDLGGRFDLDGMALWNSTESGQTDRGIETTRLSYSTDGGNSFSGSDLLTWTQLTGLNSRFEPEVQSLPRLAQGVTHVRMSVNNFSEGGSDNIVMFSELRFTGTPSGPQSLVIVPVDTKLESVNGSFIQFGNPVGSRWYDGSGLSDASRVETLDGIPVVWPTHLPGGNTNRISRIRNASQFNTLTVDLGGTFDIDGMALWNSTEAGQTARGFENTRLSYSTDGGNTFSGNDLLTWTQLSGINTEFGPEVQMLPGTVRDVTHIRMVVDNFSGSDIVMASEFRFLGDIDTSVPLIPEFSVETLSTEYNLTQGAEGDREIEFKVKLSNFNYLGVPLTFEVDDLRTGTAISGVDYAAIPGNAKIVVPPGSRTGSLIVSVIDDLSIEASETLNVRISGASSSSVLFNTVNLTGTIADNDTAGITLVGADNLNLNESGGTDTYTIALDTVPTGPVQITARADSQLRISSNGSPFRSSLNLTFTDTTPQTITVRAVNDQAIENTHSGTITHSITGTVVDDNYPDVRVEDLYTQNGTDLTFQQLLDTGQLEIGRAETTGITGSTIDVNNAVLERGIPGNVQVPFDIYIHALSNTSVGRNSSGDGFVGWTRWYQEDGKTQVFRLFEDERNVRDSQTQNARIEAFFESFPTRVWNDVSARFTVVKPEAASIFQAFQNGPDWGMQFVMDKEGNISFQHRRNYDGGETRFLVAEDMVGKSFEILVRDNGFDYEIYFNGELKGKGYWDRPGANMTFRWGPYFGGTDVTQETMVFVNNVVFRTNTSPPVGLTPYRLATTSLSIDSATAVVIDNDGSQRAFATQAITEEPTAVAEGEASAVSVDASVDSDAVRTETPSERNRMDVNGDGQVSALDALVGINYLNQALISGESVGVFSSATERQRLDVNNDGEISALDSLQIINALKRQTPITPVLISMENGNRPEEEDIDRIFADWAEEPEELTDLSGRFFREVSG